MGLGMFTGWRVVKVQSLVEPARQGAGDRARRHRFIGLQEAVIGFTPSVLRPAAKDTVHMSDRPTLLAVVIGRKQQPFQTPPVRAIVPR